MNFRMNPNSLFAILLRKPWWVSIAVAAGLFAVVRLAIPPFYAAFATLPFLVIGCYAGWQQLRAPSAARVARALDKLRAMAWEEFSAALEAAYRREGYSVGRIAGAPAELELTRAGRTALVACKRWKATRTGIDPLRELDAAKRARDAHDCIYVATAEITRNARAFAAEKGIKLLEGAELATLLGL